MGNYLTCVASISHPQCITVVHAVTEEVQKICEPIKVAELMLEYPGHFVCHSNSFSSGQRIVPLSADRELQLSQLYIVFPMNRLHTHLTDREKNFLLKVLWSSKGEKFPRQFSGVVTPWRVSSQSIEKSEGRPGAGSEAVVVSFRTARSFSARPSAQAQATELRAQLMMARCRSWKPNLQSISEISSLKG